MERRMRAVQLFHMNGRGWSDFAYNHAVDPWGLFVWEGRGVDVRPAAQGTTVGNNTSHAIYIPTGTGDPNVTVECLETIDQWGTHLAESKGIEDLLVGHRDWKDTTCPGDFLYGTLSELNENLEPVEEDDGVDSMGDIVAIFSQGDGYGMVDALGEVQTFGAPHRGDMNGLSSRLQLNSPVVDAEASVSGKGYYLAAADGGVFGFGDALFQGSMGGASLNAPIVSIEVQPGGYWLAASDGGIFAFGLDFGGRPVVI